MPWKETQKMDQKMMFVQQALNPQANFRQMRREYGTIVAGHCTGFAFGSALVFVFPHARSACPLNPPPLY